ncbi:class I SAM-dependent methyltransferase [Enterovirga rhinocerotis]|uniref:Methyltransferase family protein n=1 Tax=Enterovirga rhinocerotis TaxID=1339210 RepID=A0A4R7CBH8_9HYPH|nr:class I SAM-dependent methyltransferase [Enterovirga rhinocerotis]TDR94795.1 methyltransferase family protein [Enterovirga rhinocerotis]
MAAPFDSYSATYDDVVQRSIAFSGVRHEVFLLAKVRELAGIFERHFGPRPPDLLDVGCGIGAMHEPLQPITRSLSGCDLSADCLATARQRHPAIDYRAQDGNDLPWPDASFDATLAVCVFHHVPPAERRALLGQMARVTRPDGLVLLIEHNPWNPLTRLAVARCDLDDDAILLRAGESRRLLREAGLRDVRSHHFLLAPSAARWAGMCEAPFRALPLGAQYVAFGRV